MRRRAKGSIIDDSKHRRLLYLKTYGDCMTKTLSKGKSTVVQNTAEWKEKGHSCDKRRFRTYFGKAKEPVLG